MGPNLICILSFAALAVSADAGFFTNTPPVDYHARKSLKDCHSRYFRRSDYDIMPIYRGQLVHIGEFLHMAAIGWTTNGRTEYLCGGSLISKKFVLTAAHCASNDNGVPPNTVRLADVDLRFIEKGSRAQQVKIRSIRMHPQYRPSKKYFDIALFELETEPWFENLVCASCFWLEEDVPPEEMVAIGFGAEQYGEGPSQILQKVSLSVIDRKNCAGRLPVGIRALSRGLVDAQFCAGGDNKDACGGDSGGPIQVERADLDGTLVPLIVGIISFGTPCSNGSLGVYTRVASYRDWIEQEIQQPIDYLTCTRTSSCLSRKRVHTPIDDLKDHFRPSFRIGLLWDATEINDFQCGATLIDYRFALTSAFCARLKRNQPQYIIIESTEEIVDIESVIIHPEYIDGMAKHDLALLKLTKFLKNFVGLVPACLWRETGEFQGNVDFSAYAIKLENRERYSEDDYQRHIINVASNGKCINPEVEQDNLFCGKHSLKLIPTVCHMDFGGPVSSSYNGIDYLYGVVSKLSVGCDGELVATKVFPYVSWIESIVLGSL
ncbi:serine protease 55-like [Ochlerotatus camptorhynchus]|uniref:serine protease 55-like n=1 Tax=Ochlerotatus camptorhynchus TaxID=644619 RepID=UPI0031DB093A